MPLVSVIVPNYNHERYLKKRIQSVLEQSFQDFELILMDDCSTDNSREIIESYRQHPKVSTVLLNETNSGSTFKQWNKGVDAAKGEYIWLAESDDFADPELLAKLLSRLAQYPSAGLAYCQSWVVDQEDTVLQSAIHWNDSIDPERWHGDFFNEGRQECLVYLSQHNTIPNASAVLFKRNVFKQVGGADESFAFTGDWLLWVKMLSQTDLVFISEPLNYYRMHSQTTRAASYRNLKEIEEIYRIFAWMKNNIPGADGVSKSEYLDLSWKRALKNSIGLQTFQSLYNIYQVGEKADPQLKKRIAQFLTKKFKQYASYYIQKVKQAP